MNQIIAEETEKKNGKNSLEQIIRKGARRMLEAALETEVSDFIEKYKWRKDTDGHQTVVRNGYHPERKIQTGIGTVTMRQHRVNDRKLRGAERFSSEILPKFMRKTPSLEASLPVLYLQGISANKFPAALEAIVGKYAKEFSSSIILR